MSAAPDLLFRRLTGEESPLAAALADTVAGVDDPRCEAWGLADPGRMRNGDDVWGLFVRDALAGAAWVRGPSEGVMEISALALARRRWGMGFVSWMAEEILRAAPEECREVVVNLDRGGPALGEALEDAGFVGPGATDAGYPVGVWKRLLAIVAAGDDA